MRIGNTEINDSAHQLYNEAKSSSAEKDIGVIIDDKIKFSEHTAEKVNKVNKAVGIIRAFTAMDADMFKQLYVALVRPHLEFANQVWNPYLMRDVEAAERFNEGQPDSCPI